MNFSVINSNWTISNRVHSNSMFSSNFNFSSICILNFSSINRNIIIFIIISRSHSDWIKFFLYFWFSNFYYWKIIYKLSSHTVSSDISSTLSQIKFGFIWCSSGCVNCIILISCCFNFCVVYYVSCWFFRI